MSRQEVLITVKAYPQPSRSYDELVCTAGIRADGSWVRIYPVPFKALTTDNLMQKYRWVELDLRQREVRDFRPESYPPVKPDLSDLARGTFLDTKNHWEKRKAHCLQNFYASMADLLEHSRDPTNVSLATFQTDTNNRIQSRTRRTRMETQVDHPVATA